MGDATGSRTADDRRGAGPYRGSMKVRLSALAIAAFEVIGTFGASHNQPERKAVTALSLLLVLVGPAALAVRDRYPRSAATAGIVSSAVYVGLGYAYGPIFLGVIVGLVTCVFAGYRRDAWVLAAAALVGFAVADAVDPRSTNPGWLHIALVAAWLALVVVVADLVRVRRDREREARRLQVGEQRLALAQDLHDVLAHNISLMNVQASVALHLIDERPEQAKPALAAIKEASHTALQELRTALDLLRDEQAAPRTPAPTLADLVALVDGVRASGMDVTLRVDATPALPPSVEVAAYRIVQEALTNVTRHAHASSASVEVGYDSDVVVTVTDNGVGGAPVAGNGLVGMRERATALGGTLDAGPAPGRGFVVSARLPVPEQ